MRRWLACGMPGVSAEPLTARPARPDTAGTAASNGRCFGDQAAVVVPVADFLRPRALQQAATPEDLEDADDTAAVLEWKARDAAGQTTFVPAGEARRRLGMPR